MIKIKVDDRKLKELQKVVSESGRRLPRELNTAINKTLTRAKSIVAEPIAGPKGELNTSQKSVKQALDTKLSSSSSLQAKITLRKTERIAISRKTFRARQNKKGVSYKISRRGPTRTIIGGFMVQQYGDHVYKRSSPLRATGARKYGPSPWGVYFKKNLDKSVREKISNELTKQIDARIRFLKLKNAGTI